MSSRPRFSCVGGSQACEEDPYQIDENRTELPDGRREHGILDVGERVEQDRCREDVGYSHCGKYCAGPSCGVRSCGVRLAKDVGMSDKVEGYDDRASEGLIQDSLE